VHREADFAAAQTPFNDLKPADSWQQANELLATGGSLTDVTYHLENYLRRGRATLESQSEMVVSEVEAWSLLGRVHAMNEKEDKALAAFEAGRKALEAGQGGQNIAGEMLTVSYLSPCIS
jgi:peroxin-5